MFGTIVTIFYLQEMGEEDKLLNLDLHWKKNNLWKNSECLAAWNKELTFLGPPVMNDNFFQGNITIKIDKECGHLDIAMLEI